MLGDRRLATVNDLHSKLNPTPVSRIFTPATVADCIRAVQWARRTGQALAISGGRHAMGGQQFAAGAALLDMRGVSRAIDLDTERGTMTVEAGIQWPALLLAYLVAQRGRPLQWGIAQKQTGADRLTLGGAASANVHGRGLRLQPFVNDVLSLQMVTAEGELVTASRTENAELFRLAMGGYGLLGVITSLELALVPREKVERRVSVERIDALPALFESRIAEGCTYGDFQFAVDPASADFLRAGVLSCYRPVPLDTPIPARQIRLTQKRWKELIVLAHLDKSAAFRAFRDFYLATDGQIYWSDTHQLNIYLEDYHPRVDAEIGAHPPGTEVITELYVAREKLVEFMARARELLRASAADVIYGTVRLIERDAETFLAWAKAPYACVIFNLHTEHSPRGIEANAERFRALIDVAIELGGSYFLTYHTYARRDQVLRCYPELPDFLRLKREYDPEERFQSEWYRRYRDMLLG